MNGKTRSGKALSGIALGTMYFGSRISEKKGEELLDTFLAMGGNQIDTARSYAGWIPGGEGASEQALGRYLKKYPREDIYLGTKGGLMPRGYNETRGDLSPDRIKEEIESSLKALDTEYIDLYWLHRDDLRYSAGEIVEQMNEWIGTGKIRSYGVSNWSTARIREANEYAWEKGMIGIAASQIQYSLGICTGESWGDPTIVCMNQSEYEQYCCMQLPVYAYSAQAEGYFSLYNRFGPEGLGEDTRHKYDCPENRRRAGILKELEEKRGISLFWVMAEYILESSFPGVFILGGSNVERLKEIMTFYNKKERQLTAADWEALSVWKSPWRQMTEK